MKLTKERAKKPIIESGYGGASVGYDSDKCEATFTLNCNGPWVQGKGSESSYTLHLTKVEMLHTVSEWMNALRRSSEIENERRAAKAIATAS